MNSVISGERPAAFGVLAYLPESLAATQGAPIKTVLFTPTITYPQWAGPTTNTPHPHAAMLFLDYVVGREGAQAWSDSQGNYSARTDVVYKQPWLAALKQRVDSLQTFQLDDTTFGNDLAAVQKRMQQAYGLQ